VRVKYQTLEIGRFDIHLCTLRDKQQFSDPKGSADALGISSATWSMFGVVWDSSRVLANFMLESEVQGKRILEIGCGVALTSLMLKQRKMDITATDHHPDAHEQLKRNSLLNNGDPIPFVRSAWKDEDNKLGRFDVIIGSDVLYDRRHLQTLAGFFARHAKPQAEIILVDPGRGECARFSKLLIAQGYNDLPVLRPEAEYLEMPFKGRILRFQR
jgi:predicted nicotinamide N-methyase